MKKCPACKEQISPKAETCPHCGHPLKKQTSGCTWVALICIIVTFVFSGIVGVNTEPYEAPPPREKDPADYAITMSWEFVKSRLKSPSTADFARINEHAVYNLKDAGEHAYQVHGYVDAQNSFGTLIRQNFIVELQHVGDDNWRLISIQIK